MADTKVSSFTALLGSELASGDLFPLIDVSATGSTKNKIITRAELANAVAGRCDVRTYGAYGDARKVTDAVLNGTTTVTSATAAFTSSDVGKVIWGIETASGVARLAKTTIASVTNATTIVVGAAASGSYSSISLILGTDATSAIQAAAAAADAQTPKGCVFLPAGGYVFSDRLFNQTTGGLLGTYSVEGEGSTVTVLYPTPDHAKTGGVIFNSQSNAYFAFFRGFAIDGSMVTFTGSPNIATSPGRAFWSDVRIVSFKGATALMQISTTECVFLRCWFEGANYIGISINGDASFTDCYSGNHGYISVYLVGGKLRWDSGALDECAGPTLYVTGGEAWVHNVIVYAGASQNAIELTGSSVLRAMQSPIGPFGSNNNVTGLKVGASAAAYLIQCSLTGSGSGKGLDNSGTVYDGGNNSTNTKTGGGTISAALAL